MWWGGLITSINAKDNSCTVLTDDGGELEGIALNQDFLQQNLVRGAESVQVQPGTQCAICYSEISEAPTVQLPCKHIYVPPPLPGEVRQALVPSMSSVLQPAGFESSDRDGIASARTIGGASGQGQCCGCYIRSILAIAGENRQLCILEPEDLANCAINGTPPQMALAAHAPAAAHGTEAGALQMSTEINLSEGRSERSGSGYYGVSKFTSDSGLKVSARLRVEGKDHYIGSYDTAKEAARAVAMKHTEVMAAASLSSGGNNHVRTSSSRCRRIKTGIITRTSAQQSTGTMHQQTPPGSKQGTHATQVPGFDTS